MTPSRLQEKVVAERVAWVRTMLHSLQELPLQDRDTFFSDPRNPAAAESYLRRGLEALLDLGRHLLAKGFGNPAAEYRQIARGLHEVGVLAAENAELLEKMAAYRNRMVHFYSKVSETELYELATHRRTDIERVLESLLTWIREHPERIDRSL